MDREKDSVLSALQDKLKRSKIYILRKRSIVNFSLIYFQNDI